MQLAVALSTYGARCVALRLTVRAGAGEAQGRQAPDALHTLVVLLGSNEGSGQAAHRIALEHGILSASPVHQPCDTSLTWPATSASWLGTISMSAWLTPRCPEQQPAASWRAESAALLGSRLGEWSFRLQDLAGRLARVQRQPARASWKGIAVGSRCLAGQRLPFQRNSPSACTIIKLQTLTLHCWSMFRKLPDPQRGSLCHPGPALLLHSAASCLQGDLPARRAHLAARLRCRLW